MVAVIMSQFKHVYLCLYAYMRYRVPIFYVTLFHFAEWFANISESSCPYQGLSTDSVLLNPAGK